MKIKTSKVLYSFIIYYPILYLYTAIISNDLARKLSLLAILMLIINIILTKKKSKIISLSIVLILTAYNLMAFGLDYVIHQDFYGYVLLILICISCSSRNVIALINNLLTKKSLNTACVLFLLGIVISILRGNGLQISYEWGTTMPLLYGPYELPHSLSYQLLILFMYASIGHHKYKKKMFIIYMLTFVLLLAWTGVRSSFLALFILLIFEYSSIKSMSKKIIIISGLLFVFLYLLFFTDFLYNNPIIQKTMQALSQKSGITNGRIDFNSYLSRVYLEKLTFFEKIMGCSIDKLRYFMSLRYATALHAHNDLLNSLLGMGAVGLILYLRYLLSLCKTNAEWIKVFIPIFVLAFTNGLFMYTAFTPCLAIFPIYIGNLKTKQIERDEDKALP